MKKKGEQTKAKTARVCAPRPVDQPCEAPRAAPRCGAAGHLEALCLHRSEERARSRQQKLGGCCLGSAGLGRMSAAPPVEPGVS